MKKENYIKPGIRVKVIESDAAVLAASDVNSSEGIGGGGKDSDGSLVPAAKPSFYSDSPGGISWDDGEE